MLHPFSLFVISFVLVFQSLEDFSELEAVVTFLRFVPLEDEIHYFLLVISSALFFSVS